MIFLEKPLFNFRKVGEVVKVNYTGQKMLNLEIILLFSIEL